MTDPNQSIVDPVANNVQPAKAEDDAKKVFAGNLAFATTEDDLKSLFSEAGKVTQAQIITRGTRSLGYGFVTFATETDAQTAIQLLNKRDVAGREISVESAKPQSAADADKAKARKTRSKPKAKDSTRAPRRARADEGEEGAAEEDAAKQAGVNGEAVDADGKPSKSAKRRQKKKAAAAAATATAGANGESAQTDANAESSEAKTRAPKPKRGPKGAPTGELSPTLVFVANVAFSTTDESLKAAFGEYKVKSAHVVKRRGGNRSKGFGFVDFEDAAEQQRAMANAQNIQIDGRQVSLQVAVQSDRHNADAAADAADAAPAAPAAPAATA